MDSTAHHLFDTAIGRCGLAWSGERLVRVALPEADAGALAERLGGRRARPPAWVRETAKRITLHVAGRPQAFAKLPLDFGRATSFEQRVYALTRAIPTGHTRSYGELARALGSNGLSRAVGQALGKNPLPIVVPCHRVLAQGGPGGFSAHGGLTVKRALLEAEGALPLPSLFDETGGLAIDAGAVLGELAARDPQLGELVAKVGPFRMAPNARFDTYEALARAIVGQQISGHAARAIFARLEAAFGGGVPRPSALRAATDETLRALGLSRPKQLALRDLAAKVEDGTVLPLRKLAPLGDQAIIDRLTAVRGIGRWTVEMLLMFRMGRPDLFPIDDLGIQKGFALAFRNGRRATRAQLLARAERWRPFRTVASWYLWRALEL